MILPGSLPEHWLKAQKLAVGLKLLRLALDKADRKKIIRTILGNLPPKKSASYYEEVAHLHPATLKVLIDATDPQNGWIKDGELYERHFCWLTAYEEVRGTKDSHPLAAAKLIANRIMMSNLGASQLIAIAKSELSESWNSRPLASPLQNFVNALRGQNLTIQRVESLAAFRKKVEKIPHRWELVENALLQQWFIWPLLILRKGEESVEFSLPFALDFDLGHDQAQVCGKLENICLDKDFEESLNNAREAAYQFWLSKRSSWPQELRERLRKYLSPSLNVAIGEHLLKPYSATIELTGKSAELYLTLSILSKLIDISAMEGVCATGMIGKKYPDWQGGADFRIRSAGNLQQKFSYAKDSYLFDKFIVSEEANSINSERHLHVSKVKKLSDAASEVFRQRWRKHQYVRAPDLSVSFKPDDPKKRYTGHPKDKNVEEVAEAIQKSGQAILNLDQADPHDVARALFYINDKSRKAANDTGQNPARHVGMYSWIRAVPDEVDNRFWQTVWPSINGDMDKFRQFQNKSNGEEKAQILAKELNKFQPEIDHPWRSPDVLVIVLPKNCGSSPEPLLAILKDKLNPSPVEFLNGLLGKTRIILCRDKVEFDSGHIPSDNVNSIPDQGTVDALKRLSIFRFGFTVGMASRLLGKSDEECQKLLDRIKKPLLIFSDGSGEYILRTRIDTTVSKKDDLAKLHHAAAHAIVGFLDSGDARHLNFNESLSPHWLHEAQWHLQRASQSDNSTIKREAEKTCERLLRIEGVAENKTMPPGKNRAVRNRVGVVEIGSRAVRLLVADVSAAIGIRVVATDVQRCNLLAKLGDEESTANEIANIARSAQQFREEALHQGADPVVVIGTEALRRVADTELYKSSQLIKDIDGILDGKSEALCSLVAGSFSLARRKGRPKRCLLIDQGAGSTEIAFGSLGPQVELLDSISIGLGSTELLKMFRSCKRDVRKLKKEISTSLRKLALPNFRCDCTLILGSVATKYAWLGLRGNKNERYNSKSVDGKILRTKGLENVYSGVAKFSSDKKWEEFQQFVAPGDSGGDEGERTVAGIVQLICILQHFKQDTFVVSAMGTRHGLAYLIGVQPAALEGIGQKAKKEFT